MSKRAVWGTELSQRAHCLDSASISAMYTSSAKAARVLTCLALLQDDSFLASFPPAKCRICPPFVACILSRPPVLADGCIFIHSCRRNREIPPAQVRAVDWGRDLYHHARGRRAHAEI